MRHERRRPDRNNLTTIEGIVLELSSKALNGAPCRIGKHVFTLFFTADTWEWVYRNQYYFDPLDLAEAILANDPCEVAS